MSTKALSDGFLKKLRRFEGINDNLDRLLNKNFSENDLGGVFECLGEILLQPQHTHEVVISFRKEILLILHSVINFTSGFDGTYDLHVQNSIVLSKVIVLHPDAENFVFNYFDKYSAPFLDVWGKVPAAKKRKLKSSNVEIKYTELDVVEACYTFLKHSPEYFRKKWSWSDFIQKYFDHSNEIIVWVVSKCIGILTGMNEKNLSNLLKKSTAELKSVQQAINSDLELSKLKQLANSELLGQNSDFNVNFKENSSLICVGGIYLPTCYAGKTKSTNIVEVKSTKNNLRAIALALATNKAICLQGPVGAGKTCLVEYLAAKTGRVLGKNLIKVQMGDQTDSKMLLGTYRCTDVPGEFVWQPGVLTQAVIEGSWLLLEDIDSASTDVASVLTSLLEMSTLTVPGFRDNVPIAVGFHLFVTQRLVSSVTGLHKNHSNAFALLENHVLQVNIDPLSPSELVEIIQTLHPPLKTIAERMVNVYLLFSKDDNEFSPKSKRLTSTRDLFKWCSRAMINFDVSSQASALKILQDAIDIFCCSISNAEEALKLSRDITTQLGIVNDKADYFLKTYKPSLSLTTDVFRAGRAAVPRQLKTTGKRSKFCFTKPAANLLERTTCCVSAKEPILFVGETGTGKTSSVQYLADVVGQKLIVINMNQQSDSADLLGGFKPVDLKFVIGPIRNEFEDIFMQYFDVECNKKFLSHVNYCFNKQRWDDLVLLMRKSTEAGLKRSGHLSGDKETRFFDRWSNFKVKLDKLEQQVKHKSALAFAFVEGSLIKAIECGHWVLLDEINLANAETLECLSGLLEGTDGSLSLLERGDKGPVVRHPDFTLFACMNPSTDVGKKDLPAGIRNRFTEFYVHELTEKNDLTLLVDSYLQAQSLSKEKIQKIVQFYVNIRKEAQTNLTDGLGHKPNFSLRSLCRALTIASKNPCGIVNRSLYEVFCVSFLTQLDSKSYHVVENLIVKYIIGSTKEINAVLKQSLPVPKGSSNEYLQFEGYWVQRGGLEPSPPENYILTKSVRKNLKDLVRIVSIGKLPVLLQGDTSVGKTSLITYLAKSTGNKCVRINNHEHTDLQEYVGSYVADVHGKLVFREGLLVEAMRKGHWIILDELNLAPTDVLEALNRVLDDNRELFIPETQQVVKADPNFMLFATQNPPGAYGGRKMLSRAFRNRFVELHFNEIPLDELEVILHKRCEMSLSYAKKMIKVMKELQVRRRGSAAFAGKQGFITLRDLFRWGERYRLAENRPNLYDYDQHLADEGYLVLAAKVRKVEEKVTIIESLRKVLKREVSPDNLFTLSDKTSTVTRHILEEIAEKQHRFPNIVWTYNMRQNAVLIRKAQEFKEPVLLVGDTGGGKTTICKILSEMMGLEMSTVNCHMHTESSDFIGSLRPVRDHSSELNRLFEWVDGPLIEAMKNGYTFLVDEISLADDSVLERLNSLLEPERSMLIAEKGTDINNPDNSELIIADDKFCFIGTMNPGGDFGKKELSPALRNRFTEIWCEARTRRDDLIAIISRHFEENVDKSIAVCVMDFVEWFQGTAIGKKFTISIRDILTWVNFINVSSRSMSIFEAYTHGACLTFLDSFGSGVTSVESTRNLETFRQQCLKFIAEQLLSNNFEVSEFSFDNLTVEKTNDKFGVRPFFIEMGCDGDEESDFTFDSPTTVVNALRLLRGMQLNKALLLEGSPGVGKTSLVMALAKCTRNKIFRVNLSDQTDISDLFGADLPVEGGSGGHFSWRDGPLLQALKRGHWILLDELNLASQSVLEGLNACLDHRGEIFIPELGKTFQVKSGTRFFACQNPLKQGGSRRGLPQSFLNRFIQVHINSLAEEDYFLILRKQFPELPERILNKMIRFNLKVLREIETHGSPFEFNLRDIVRWCQATIHHHKHNPEAKKYSPENLVNLIYGDRMRTAEDKQKVRELFEVVFDRKVGGVAPVFYCNKSRVYVGDASYDRNSSSCNPHVLNPGTKCLVLRKQLPMLRSLLYCVNLNWMAILVGPSGSGKSSIVKTLAKLAEQTLRILPVTSAMDTTDILGGFEQTDYTRHLEEIQKQIERVVLQTLQTHFIDDRTDAALNLLRMWESCSNSQGGKAGNKKSSTYPSLSASPGLSLSSRVDVKFKVPLGKKYANASARRVESGGSLKEQTTSFLTKLQNLKQLLGLLDKHNQKADEIRQRIDRITTAVTNEGSLNAGGKFEWVDSVLVKCLQEGSWLLIDNVNLCSPAVLDRLNGLLEPNGVLTIGERGVDAEGKMVEIKPHENFRLFLTMDPKNGDISRAMRNRGLEIYVLDREDCVMKDDFDTKSLISSQGLESNLQINSLLSIHNFISEFIIGVKPGLQELLNCSFLISQQIQRGIDVHTAFKNGVVDVYCKTRNAYDFNTNDPITTVDIEIKRLLNNIRNNKVDVYNKNVTIEAQNLFAQSEVEKIKQQFSLVVNLKDSNMMYNFLMHFFTITSKEDLDARLLYLTAILESDDLKVIVNDIYPKICEFLPKEPSNLPLDRGWLLDTHFSNYENGCNNRIFLFLFLTIKFFEMRMSRPKNTKGMTLFEYMENVRAKKVENKIDDPVATEMLNFLDLYDNFLWKSLNTIEIDGEGLIESISLIKWRFIFSTITKVNIQKISSLQYREITTNLHLHYKWFVKFGLHKLEDVLKIRCGKELREIIQEINKTLVNEFSALAKLAKYYQRFIAKPPPRVTQKQLKIFSEFRNSTKFFNIYGKYNMFNNVVSILMAEPDLFVLMIDLKSELTYESSATPENLKRLRQIGEKYADLKSVKPCCREEVLILPIVDVFIRLFIVNLKNGFGGNFQENLLKNSLTLPFALSGCLLQYQRFQDERLTHEITTETYNYLLNSAAVCPSKFLKFLSETDDDKKEVILPAFSPMLTYLTMELVLPKRPETDVSFMPFGNYREILKQRQTIGALLWMNCRQISNVNFDFLSNEVRYLNDSYNKFLDHLEKARADFDDTLGQKDILKTLLELCASEIGELNDSREAWGITNHIGNVYMILNYIKALLNSKIPLVDPLKKVTLKKSYCMEEIDEMISLKDSYVLQNTVYGPNSESLHPVCAVLEKKINSLDVKKKRYEKYVAVRPVDSSYELVMKDISSTFATILSTKQFLGMYHNLKRFSNLLLAKTCVDAADLQLVNQCLTKSSNMSVSYSNFVTKLTAHRHDYPDIVEPLLSNVLEFSYGLKISIDLLKGLLRKYEWKDFSENIDKELVDFIKFPVLDKDDQDYVAKVMNYVDDRMVSFLEKLVDDEQDQQLVKQEKFRLIKCAIQELYNFCVLGANFSDVFDETLFRKFDELLKIFISAYKRQEIEREERIKEGESLYKTKTKCFTTEEEEIESEFRELFPKFHDADFAEFQKGDLSDDPPEVLPEIDKATNISQEELAYVLGLHTQFLLNYTKTEWLDGNKAKKLQPDFVNPLLEKFRLFKFILGKSFEGLNYSMDSEICGALNVLVAALNNSGEKIEMHDIQSSPTGVQKKIFDFYRDPNIQEVKSCYHILEELRLKILGLLSEWPEHPTLKTVDVLIERIKNFDISSPLSRFLTGFEILLTKCHEWEEVAHSGVSLSEHIQNITQQIIRWRKLELNMWKNCLNTTFNKLNEPIAKWWMYMYGLLGESVVDKKIVPKELIETLQKFITQSNLAEFESRIQLLYIFHCHATYLRRTRERDIFVNVLWNVYSYFKQFLPNVLSKIKEVRSPIEKKLRDYVKIVRWKDISYWAIKETLDKTHRTLHKYMREFKHALSQPVVGCLVNSTTREAQSVGIWDRPQRHQAKDYHYTLDSSIYMAKQSFTKRIKETSELSTTHEILKRTESYFKKARILCKTTVEETKYPSLMKTLDGFVDGVIETSNHLQNLEVNRALGKEKQKSQLKHILQQKHRALADLFKTLSKIGLSHRSGIIQAKMDPSFKEFLMRPINLNSTFTHLNYTKTNERILTIWESCEMYYNRSLMRLDVLETALKTPAKDLGLQNIERCKGFSVNLMDYTGKLKEQLVENSRYLYYVKYYTSHFEMFCSERDFLSLNTVGEIQKFALNAILVLAQYKVLLRSCPEESSFGNDFKDIPVLKTEPQDFIGSKYDPLWMKTMDSLSEATEIAQKLQVSLEKCKANVPSVECSLEASKFIPINSLDNILKEIDKLKDKMSEIQSVFGDISLTKSLRWLCDEARDLRSKIEEDLMLECNETTFYTKNIQTLIERVVLSIQNVYKKYNNQGNKLEENDDQFGLYENHLKQFVIQDLADDFQCLDMKNIFRSMHSLARKMFCLNPNAHLELQMVVSRAIPLLEQLIVLYQYFLTQQVSAYRVTCKMSSVLLNIFIELTSKGFCIPPEFSDEMDSEGNAQSSGGMGLGDGEGEKDVSDRIESEDQLDDAQPAGKENEEKDDADCNEEDKGIEMSEDFNSKLQDKKQKDEGDDDNSSNSDAEEQMGDTEEGANNLDQEIWGEDDEEAPQNEEDDTQQKKDELGEKGEDTGEKELSAKNDKAASQDNGDDPKKDKKDGEEINEMDEKEFDDEQVDPYHGNQPELPEPEPMDLPDDLEMNDQDEDKEIQEENPFDIDKQKDEYVPDALDDIKSEEKDAQNEENNDEHSEDGNGSDGEQETAEEHAGEDEVDTEIKAEGDKRKEEDAPEEEKESGDIETDADQTSSAQNEAQSIETDTSAAADNVQGNEDDHSEKLAQQLSEENSSEKEGMGQSEMKESAPGHSGEADTQVTQANETESRKRERRQKPGEADTQRSLGEVNEPVKKKLKTVKAEEKPQGEDKEEQTSNEDVEMVQHVDDAKETDAQVLDAATEEQVEEQRKEAKHSEEENTNKDAESANDLLEEEDEDVEMADVAKQIPEKLEKEETKKSKSDAHPDGDVLEEMQEMTVEGDAVETMTVPRGGPTSYYTQYQQLNETLPTAMTNEDVYRLRSEVQNQLSNWSEIPSTVEAEQTWRMISSVTSSLAQDLSEQLRLVLEPTQASRLKGDFRTGRRINMRKVIPYIASQFRKDKIWLRRTKPSKREYQIVLAIDDSSSMADNKSKELTFESVSLISKALTLLESGQLSVLSFGERTQVVHKLGDPFTEKSGGDLLQKFQFSQTKTCVADLVNFATEMLNTSQMNTQALNAKLLVIISDGRLSTDSELALQQAVRRAKLNNVFMVFVIVENQNYKDSILDVQKAVFRDGKCILNLYMDSFPFPFYLIVRDIACIPTLLSDALKQWFEIVSNVER